MKTTPSDEDYLRTMCGSTYSSISYLQCSKDLLCKFLVYNDEM